MAINARLISCLHSARSNKKSVIVYTVPAVISCKVNRSQGSRLLVDSPTKVTVKARQIKPAICPFIFTIRFAKEIDAKRCRKNILKGNVMIARIANAAATAAIPHLTAIRKAMIFKPVLITSSLKIVLALPSARKKAELKYVIQLIHAAIVRYCNTTPLPLHCAPNMVGTSCSDSSMSNRKLGRVIAVLVTTVE